MATNPLKSLPLKIAWRYLTAPKSHGAVNAISIVSVVGVTIATAAIIIVLSVFNGFRHNLNERLDNLTADVSIYPAYGKVIYNADSIAKRLKDIEQRIEIAMPAVTDNALVLASDREMPITLKGVNPDFFARITAADSIILEGTPISDFHKKEAAISIGVAQQLQIYSPETEMLLFAPRREGRVNLANPVTSFVTDSLYVKAIFRSMQAETDENTVVTDIETARNLFHYDTEATSIEIKVSQGSNPAVIAKELKEGLGENFVVKDRFEQQQVNFRMVAIEKWITFLLLSFILLIASFNIISTLSMLIVEKEASLTTLSRIGMSAKKIGNIFKWESMLVTLSGALIGLALGISISLLQQHFGFIKIAGNPDSLFLSSYPVKVEWLDLLITFVPILIIGFITSSISFHFAKNKIKPT